MQNSVDDLKTLRNYAIGVVGFGTTISAVLIQVMHFQAEPTIASVIGFALLMLLVGYLINQAEQRQRQALKDQTDETNAVIGEFKEDLTYLKKMALENQMSSLRNEMNGEIYRNPHNHDTILEFAHRYFVELGGDWVQTDLFLRWVDSENEQGYTVHIPSELSHAVNTKHELENKT